MWFWSDYTFPIDKEIMVKKSELPFRKFATKYKSEIFRFMGICINIISSVKSKRYEILTLNSVPPNSFILF